MKTTTTSKVILVMQLILIFILIQFKSTATFSGEQNIGPIKALFLTSREIIGTDDVTNGTKYHDISEPTGDSNAMKVECNYAVTYILR
jgi:hypothetical protein